MLPFILLLVTIPTFIMMISRTIVKLSHKRGKEYAWLVLHRKLHLLHLHICCIYYVYHIYLFSIFLHLISKRVDSNCSIACKI